MKEIDLSYQTLFAELLQRCLDAEFDADFPETGSFKRVTVKGRAYWYFQHRTDGRAKQTYVGPVSDEEIDRRVASFKTIKDDFRRRRKLVATLVREAYLPQPERFTGDLIEAFWKAGLFRLRAVLVGTSAYQCYSGLLGIRLPLSQMQTGDVDFAQFHSISLSVEDSLPPILEVLSTVDATFHEIPHVSGETGTTRFVNDKGFKVEFLTPNTGSARHDGHPAPMPALGGAAAEPLRFLDFLITDPVRSVVLHKGGIPVRVPAPERYAMHKLIVATRWRREGMGVEKRDKDAAQAGQLAAALTARRRAFELAEVFVEAWNRGPAWREALRGGRLLLPDGLRAAFDEALRDGLKDLGLAGADEIAGEEPVSSLFD